MWVKCKNKKKRTKKNYEPPPIFFFLLAHVQVNAPWHYGKNAMLTAFHHIYYQVRLNVLVGSFEHTVFASQNVFTPHWQLLVPSVMMYKL